MAAAQAQSDCQPQILSSSNNLGDKDHNSPSFTNGNDDSSRGSSSNDGYPSRKTGTPPGSTPNSPLVAPMVCQRTPFPQISSGPGAYPGLQQPGAMPLPHHTLAPGYGAPMVTGHYPMMRAAVPPPRPSANHIYNQPQSFSAVSHGYHLHHHQQQQQQQQQHHHTATAATWEPPVSATAPYSAPAGAATSQPLVRSSSASSQQEGSGTECAGDPISAASGTAAAGGGGLAAAGGGLGTNGQSTSRPVPSPSSSAGSRSMSPAIGPPNIPTMPPRPASSHSSSSVDCSSSSSSAAAAAAALSSVRLPQSPHAPLYPQPLQPPPVPQKMAAAATSGPSTVAPAAAGLAPAGYPGSHSGLHAPLPAAYGAMYSRPPHYPAQYPPGAPGYPAAVAAGGPLPPPPPHHMAPHWGAVKQAGMYPAPPRSPQYLRHQAPPQLPPAPHKMAAGPVNGGAPSPVMPPPCSTPQPAVSAAAHTVDGTPVSDSSAAAAAAAAQQQMSAPLYPAPLPPIGPDGVPLDDASQHSTLSNTSITSEDRSRSPKPRKDLSSAGASGAGGGGLGAVGSHPSTPCGPGAALSPGGPASSFTGQQQQQQQGTPPHHHQPHHPHPHPQHPHQQQHPQQQQSEDSEHTSMSSPTTSWPRSPVSMYNPASVGRDHYQPVRPKADSLKRLYDIDDNPMRRDFLNRLLAFMEERATPILQCPTVSKQPLDLFRLYRLTNERGGFEEVTKNKVWKDVAVALGIGGSSSGAYTLRKHYMKNLIHYEYQFDRGGMDPAPVLAKYETKSAKKKAVSSPGPQDSFSNSGSMDDFPSGYCSYGGGGGGGGGGNAPTPTPTEYSNSSTSSNTNTSNNNNNNNGANSSNNNNNGPSQSAPPQGYPLHGYQTGHPGYGHYPVPAAGGGGPAAGAGPADYTGGQGHTHPGHHYMQQQYGSRSPYHHHQQQQQQQHLQQQQQQQPPSGPGSQQQSASVDYRYQGGAASMAPGSYGAGARHPYPGVSTPPPPPVPAPSSAASVSSASAGSAAVVSSSLSTGEPTSLAVSTAPPQFQPYSSGGGGGALMSEGGATSVHSSGAAYGGPISSAGAPSVTAPSRRLDSSAATGPAATAPAAGPAAPVSYSQPPYGWRGYQQQQQQHQPQHQQQPQQQQYAGPPSPAWPHSHPAHPAARYPGPAAYSQQQQQQPAAGAWPQNQPGAANMTHSSRLASIHRPAVVSVKDRALASAAAKVGGMTAAAGVAPRPAAAAAAAAAVTFPADSVESVTPLLVKRRRLARADVCPTDGWRLVMALRSGQLAETRAALDQLLVLSRDDTTVGWLLVAHLPGLLPALLHHWRHALAAVLGAPPSDHEPAAGGAADPSGAGVKCESDAEALLLEQLGVCAAVDPTDKQPVLHSTDYTLSTRQRRLQVLVDDKRDAILVADRLPSHWSSDGDDTAADWTHVVPCVRVESHRLPLTRHLTHTDTPLRRSSDQAAPADAASTSTRHHPPSPSQPPPPQSLPNFDTDIDFFLSRLRPKTSSSVPCPSPPTPAPAAAATAPTPAVSTPANTVKVEPDAESLLTVGPDPARLCALSTAAEEVVCAGGERCRVRDPAGVLKRRRADAQLEDECCERRDPATQPLTLIGDSQLAVLQRCVALTTLLRNLSFVPGNEPELAIEPILAPLADMLLLQHRHPGRSTRHHNYDRDEDADFAPPFRSTTTTTAAAATASGASGCDDDADCWWHEYVPLLHEHALVTLSNLCGHVRLAEHDEQLVLPLLDGLLHWLVCSSSYAGDPLPSAAAAAGASGATGAESAGGGGVAPGCASACAALSPRRLALECVCRLCVCGDNVDLLLATPPLGRLRQLCHLAAGWLAAAGDDQVLRELSLSLVYYLSGADERAARWLCEPPGFVAALVRFVETAEHNALAVANSQGVHSLRDNPDLMGTSLDMLGRAATTLLQLARVEANRHQLLACEQRLLQLVMSQILDQRVAATLAHVLHRVARPASPPCPLRHSTPATSTSTPASSSTDVEA